MTKSKSPSKDWINKTELKKMLRLTDSAFQYLIDAKILKFEKIGRENLFSIELVKIFQQLFNRDDYITKGEIDKKLEKYNFTTFRPKANWNVPFNPLDIYVNGKALIEGGGDIPPDYKLTGHRFGKTIYIERSSFAKTLNWLRGVNHKVNPKPTKEQKEKMKEFTKEFGEKRKTRRRGIGGIRGKRTKKR
jgi:hypothetical protein